MRNLLLTALLGVFSSLAVASDFSLVSPQILPGKTIAPPQVFNGYGCNGGNHSPQLDWRHAPSSTKSYALTVFDPDAPGHGWWHWLIFNIPVQTHRLVVDAGDLTRNLAPHGSVQSRTDFGHPGYGGPCPPRHDRAHRYRFTVYALDIDRLALNQQASPDDVMSAIQAHMLDQAVLTAYYVR